MRILGIDPGYAIVGFGIIDSGLNSEIIDYGIITTLKEDRLPVRLQTIEKCLESLIKKYRPDAIAIEELFYFKNQKTVIPVAEARGVIVLTCNRYTDKIFEYTPLQVKQALTGQGRAEKAQVQYMVKTTLGLAEIPKPDDAADALALAICHAQMSPVLNFNQV